jgi:hypothetical protein
MTVLALDTKKVINGALTIWLSATILADNKNSCQQEFIGMGN